MEETRAFTRRSQAGIQSRRPTEVQQLSANSYRRRFCKIAGNRCAVLDAKAPDMTLGSRAKAAFERGGTTLIVEQRPHVIDDRCVL